LFGVATPGIADTFNVHFPPPGTVPDTWGLNSVHGAGTSGSFAAAAMMGAKGWNNYVPPANWENLIITDCKADTNPASKWPSTCDPAGMMSALSVAPFSMPPPLQANWAISQYDGPINPTTHVVDPSLPDPNKPYAMNAVVNSLRIHGSPAVIPMYGQADHWIAIIQVTATLQSSGLYGVNTIKYYDGGPAGQQDTSQQQYAGVGVYSMGSIAFNGGYYSVLTAINPQCDPCISDPYYGKWLMLYEPPAGEAHPPGDPTVAVRAPGVSKVMNEKLAQLFVWRSLVAAGIDKDPQMWSALSAGIAGPAVRVAGVFPSGAPWNYFLVPILQKTNTKLVIGFVQLAADDGAFELVHLLPSPAPFTPMDHRTAGTRAGQLLARGESLTTGTLVWDPRKNTPSARTPTSPYFEFPVTTGTADKRAEFVRVRFNDGLVSRGE
jgi:hypothetical protein